MAAGGFVEERVARSLSGAGTTPSTVDGAIRQVAVPSRGMSSDRHAIRECRFVCIPSPPTRIGYKGLGVARAEGKTTSCLFLVRVTAMTLRSTIEYHFRPE